MVQPQIWRYGSMMDAFPEFRRLRREMDRLFSAAPPLSALPSAAGFPAINVWVGQEDAVVTTELPGVDPEKLDISMVGDVLKIAGFRAGEAGPEVDSYYRQERSYGSFTRTLQLPFQAEASKVEAKYEKGILQIVLPRAEAEKPKKIIVKKD